MTDLIIEKGKTFSHEVRWASKPYIYKAITGITQAAPAVVSAAAHGLVDGQQVAIVSVLGMTEINSENSPPRLCDFLTATYIDANSVSFNEINSSEFTAYASGGYLQYLTPVDLTGYIARMSIKDYVGGTELLRLDSDANLRIVINAAAQTIVMTVSATDTAAITWADGVYDLELVSPGGVVSLLLSGGITVEDEVTTT